MGLAGGINLYAYVGNNPLLWADPYGLGPLGITGAVLQATGGTIIARGGLANPIATGIALGLITVGTGLEIYDWYVDIENAKVLEKNIRDTLAPEMDKLRDLIEEIERKEKEDLKNCQ